MKTYTGLAKVKDDSNYKYAGLTLKITGLYVAYKNGIGEGIYPDGSSDWHLSLEGHNFEYQSTIINDYFHLEMLELHQSIKMPFDDAETKLLLSFAKLNTNLTEEDILSGFIRQETKQIPLPVYDESTILSEEEWKLKRESKAIPLSL